MQSRNIEIQHRLYTESAVKQAIQLIKDELVRLASQKKELNNINSLRDKMNKMDNQIQYLEQCLAAYEKDEKNL